MSPESLAAACVSVLRGVGCPDTVSRTVADHLVMAELRGQASHGITRLPTYVARVKSGLICPEAVPRVVSESPSTVLLDAGSTFGHVAGKQAMELCVSRASATGVAAVGVRNSTHFGLAGVYALQATEQKAIGIVCSNAAARMPPAKTRTAVLGTNPLAIAVPTRSKYPILLDMATSAVALGRILEAQRLGASIPIGWALSHDGRPTVDPAEAAKGLLLPMAGPKGFGLAFALEVLAAVLTGASVGQNAGSMYQSWDRTEDLGHMFIAVSIEAFIPLETFLERLEDLSTQVARAQPLEPGERAYLPGELEFMKEEENRRLGIPMSDERWAPIAQLGEVMGLSLRRRAASVAVS